MRPYEVMVIFDASLEEDAVRALVDRFTHQLTAAGPKSVKADSWGKRRLAYPVRHRNEGYYVVIEANAEPAALSDLDRQLSLTDEVIRHKVLRLPERAAGRSRPATSHGTGHCSGRQHERSMKMAQDNTVSIVGNLTREPELRFTPSGQATATFGIAVNRTWTDRQSQETAGVDVFLRRRLLGQPGRERRHLVGRGTRVVVTGPARPALLGDPGRRQALEGRDHRRRDSPQPALGDGTGDQERAPQPGQLQRRPARHARTGLTNGLPLSAAPASYGAGHEDEEPF